MKYYSKDHDVVIESRIGSRGIRVLELLGFESEVVIDARLRKEQQLQSLKEFAQERKKEKEQQEKLLNETTRDSSTV
jgi:DNA mismatch repair ATPase MutS